RLGEVADVEEAIKAYRTGLEVKNLSKAHRAKLANNLAYGLRERYGITGASTDLDESICWQEEAVRTTAETAPQLATYLNNLGNKLRDRYNQAGQAADLSLAFEAIQRAVDCSRSTLEQAMLLNNLGLVLRDLYLRSGDTDFLEQAIGSHQKAVGLVPSESPDWPAYLSGLCTILLDRFQHYGKLADLDEATRLSRHALTTVPASSPYRSRFFNNLGGILGERFICIGELGALEESAECYRQAVQNSAGNPPERLMHLTNWATSVRELYARKGNPAHLDKAIEIWADAMSLGQKTSPLYASLLNGYALGLSDRYALNRHPEDMHQAIEYHRQAVALTPVAAPAHAIYLDNLANALYNQYVDVELNDIKDLEEAITCWHDALATAAPRTTTFVQFANNLAAGLQQRYVRRGETEDLKLAVQYWRVVCEQGNEVFPAGVLSSGRSWGEMALSRGSWAEAVEAFTHSLESANQLFQKQLLRGDRESWLRHTQGLAAQAAYASARLGEYRRAVTILETGQSRLLSVALERNHADIERLQSDHPEVIERYRQVVNRIALLEKQELDATQSDHQLVSQAQLAYQDLQDIIATIKQLDGYQDLFAQPTFESVAQAAIPGQALVYLITTFVGSLALIIRDESGDSVEPVWCDEFKTAGLIRLLLPDQVGGESMGGYLGGQLISNRLSQSLDELLPTLGSGLIAPLAEQLRNTPTRELILIPGGRLSLLPLHAASYMDGNRLICLLDEFAISYAPSTRAITTARRMLLATRPEPAKLVGIANPAGYSQPLQYAQAELECIARNFDAYSSCLLFKDDADLGRLLSSLPGADVVHLACHGSYDLREPLDSRLVLTGNDVLTLRQVLTSKQWMGVRLVVMSACQTALSEFTRLPDEVVGLPAGILQAGVPGVIGTLCPQHVKQKNRH
ncbi:MAG: CHAT domain-containing protein, partial [Candidatus Marsarchaeota archaeon]|nr:CHAT domain-containing protein [Candidatus Marsarchaeota archaeon]